MEITEAQQTKKLLIVEDNPGDLKLIKQALSFYSDSLKIHSCSSMSEAMEINKIETFDAVILDLGLPDSSGIDSVEKIRKYNINLPIIVLTVSNYDEIGIEAIKHGAQDYITKEDLNKSNLIRIIRYSIERKKLEIKLNESLRLLEETFEQAVVGMAQITSEGNYLKINQKFCDIIGYSKEELSNKNIKDTSYKEDLKNDLENLRLLVSGEINFYSVEKRFVHKNGSIVWTNLTRTAIFHPIEKSYSYFTTIEDITERKNLEQQLKSSIQEKEMLVKESHHRIKNNLQIVSSLLKYPILTVQNEEVKNLLIDSQNRIKSISMVHDFLYKSTELNLVNAQSYLHNLLDYLRSAFNADLHKIKIIKSIDDVIIKSDFAVSIGLIINELVTNSIKYAFVKKEKGTITVEFKITDRDIILIVKDDGIGMPDNLDLYKAETFGLQIVTSLVSQHEGKINFMRINGTEFLIKFPRQMHGNFN